MADPSLGLYVVCDGMGGGNAGEIASTLAVEAIQAHLAEAVRHADLPLIGPFNATVSVPANRLASAIRAANEVVHRESWSRPDYAGMGTTVVAALLREEVLAIAHVGDSRLYLVRNGTIQALTTDHSWVAEQILKGLITQEEAECSPRRNIVTKALGVESSVDVELTEVPVKSGDMLLLCSDGLTRGVHRTTSFTSSVDRKTSLPCPIASSSWRMKPAATITRPWSSWPCGMNSKSDCGSG